MSGTRPKGSIRERSLGVFEVRLSTGVDPLIGKRQERSRTVHGTRADAETMLDRMVAVEETTRSRVDKRDASATVTLAEAVQLYLSSAQLAPGTLKAYRSLTSRHIEPLLGGTAIGRIDRSVLERFYEQLSGSGLSPSTVRSVHVVINQALRVAVQREWLWANPAADANLPIVERAPGAGPTVAQLGEVMAMATESDPDSAVFLGLAIATRARRSELCALRWTSVDLDRKIVHIHSNVVVADGGLRLRELSPRVRRSVPIDEATVNSLRQHRRSRRVDAVGGAFVFSSQPDGSTPWRPELPSKRWADLRQRVGLDHLRLQDLQLVRADSPEHDIDAEHGDVEKGGSQVGSVLRTRRAAASISV